MAKIPRSANYSVDEIEALVELRSELDPTWLKLAWLVRLWDLDTAIRNLPPKEYQAVLLIGLIGIDIRTAGKALECSHTTAWRRYQRGIEYIVNYLNGGYGFKA